MSTQHIFDEGSLHKYRTEIPNIVVRGSRSRGLSIYAKWLYVYCKSVAGDNGHCTKSTTTMVQEVGMSRGQISAARKELVQAQLIRMTAGKRKNRDSLTIHIVDIWPENMQECSVHNTNSGVHNMNTGTIEETSNYQSGVHNTNSGVHNTNSGVHVVDPKKIPLRRRSKEKHMSTNSDNGRSATAKTYTKGFEAFWSTWHTSPRKIKKSLSFGLWQRHQLEARTPEVCQKVAQWWQTEAWKNGYEPMPQTWLSQRQYNDDVPTLSAASRRCPPHTVRRNFSDDWICHHCHTIFSETLYRTLVATGDIA